MPTECRSQDLSKVTTSYTLRSVFTLPGAPQLQPKKPPGQLGALENKLWETGKFLTRTAQRHQLEQLQTIKSQVLVSSPEAALLSPVGHLFVQCAPGGGDDGLANYTEKRGI